MMIMLMILSSTLLEYSRRRFIFSELGRIFIENPDFSLTKEVMM